MKCTQRSLFILTHIWYILFYSHIFFSILFCYFNVGTCRTSLKVVAPYLLLFCKLFLSPVFSVNGGQSGDHSEDPSPPLSARSTWFIPHHFLVGCCACLGCRCDYSLPSAVRLLSHSHHVIPFPVSDQEFWPFSLCHSPGRQQTNKMLSCPSQQDCALSLTANKDAASVCAALSELALALACSLL